MRLISETKQVEEGLHRTANGELIRVQDANNDEGQQQQLASSTSNNNESNATPGLLESCLSPDLPDRKRYAIKEKVSLGLYKPSFTMQPDTASLTNVFREQRNTSTNLNERSVEEFAPGGDDDQQNSPTLKLTAAGGLCRNSIEEDDGQQ